MKLIDRYIGVAVAGSTLIVLLVLLALFSFGTFVNELGEIGKSQYTLPLAAEYTLLTLPDTVYQLFPLVALLGGVVGLGMLASHSELLVMRAAGISTGRIMWAVMKVGLLWMIIALLLGEYVAPRADHYAQALRAAALSERFLMTSRNGLWARNGLQFIHIRNVLSEQAVNDVTIYEFDRIGRLQKVTTAQSGRYQQRDWILEQVVQNHVGPDGVTTQRMAQLHWHSLLTPDLIGMVAVKPDNLSISDLIGYIHYLKRNSLSASRYQLSLWNKLIQPITAMVMVVLALPFIFGPLRSVSVGQRVFVGLLVGIGFYLIDRLFTYVGLVYDIPPVISAGLPTTIFLVSAVLMMRRIV